MLLKREQPAPDRPTPNQSVPGSNTSDPKGVLVPGTQTLGMLGTCEWQLEMIATTVSASDADLPGLAQKAVWGDVFDVQRPSTTVHYKQRPLDGANQGLATAQKPVVAGALQMGGEVSAGSRRLQTQPLHDSPLVTDRHRPSDFLTSGRSVQEGLLDSSKGGLDAAAVPGIRPRATSLQSEVQVTAMDGVLTLPDCDVSVQLSSGRVMPEVLLQKGRGYGFMVWLSMLRVSSQTHNNNPSSSLHFAMYGLLSA